RHQGLRPRHRAHRRRPGPGDAAAGHLHVLLHLHPQPHGHRRLLGHHHAGDDLLDHHPLPLFRAARREALMSTPPSGAAISSGKLTRALIYAALIAFACFYLLPLYVMVVNSLKPLDEIRQGGMLNLPQSWTIEPWLSAW